MRPAGHRAGPGARWLVDSCACVRVVLALLCVVAVVGAFPGRAAAHGPVAPIASSFLARVSQVPAGLQARVVDGDLRLWLAVRSGETVVVLGYSGEPYLRFSRSGVQVNVRSAIYYLNLVPAQPPPPNLTSNATPQWQRASTAHEYLWPDGRLGALAATARAPDAAYLGRWKIPVRVDGRLTSISGGLSYAPDPSIVWFWPIAVVIACVLAARRLRRRELDTRLARGLATGTLIALAAGAAGQVLEGRPTVAVGQPVTLGVIIVVLIAGLVRLLRQGPGLFLVAVIAAAGLMEGVLLITTLTHGYVLAAVPAFVERAAAVICMGSGVSLLLLLFGGTLGDEDAKKPRRRRAAQPRESRGAPVRAG
ncbi:MAG: hypothetical protein ACR2OB_13565 [Solirubrobacteraceae bacterium]